SESESLDEMLARKDEIKEKFKEINPNKKHKSLLGAVLDEDDDDDDEGCLVCFK
ncbi:MAG: phosphoadenosine phosphosulfate reductase, partial [Methylococcaceae bacterium]|nr:phosphoadenosine phosphosulfate reductase [Methylococcaceae bacterium]